MYGCKIFQSSFPAGYKPSISTPRYVQDRLIAGCAVSFPRLIILQLEASMSRKGRLSSFQETATAANMDHER
jgi:hypothetical protein